MPLGSDFDRAYRTLAPALVRYVQRFIPRVDEAEDLVQDVFLSVWQRREAIAWDTDDNALAAYLFAAVRRRAYEYARHQRVVERTTATADTTDPPAMGRPAQRPDAAAVSAEIERLIDDMLATLPDRQRALLILRWKDRLTYEEIADVLGVSVPAAKTQVSRTLKALRPLFERLL